MSERLDVTTPAPPTTGGADRPTHELHPVHRLALAERRRLRWFRYAVDPRERDLTEFFIAIR